MRSRHMALQHCKYGVQYFQKNIYISSDQPCTSTDNYPLINLAVENSFYKELEDMNIFDHEDHINAFFEESLK